MVLLLLYKKQMKISFFSAFFASLIVFSSCTKDVGPNPDLILKTASACDSVTFAKHIMPIFTNSCVNCHSPSGGTNPDLTTYDLIKTQVDAGLIKARVIDQLPTPMPQGGPLPQTELDLVKCWLEAGAPNN
jgi:predicted CXXCH cytochrome family protein